MQEHVGRSRRPDSEESADDAAHRHGRLQLFRFKPLIEEIHGAHGEELQSELHHVHARVLEVPPELEELDQFRRVQARRGGDGRVDDRSHESSNLAHRVTELGQKLRVVPAEPRDFLSRQRRVGPAAQGATVRERQEGRLERDHLQAEARQLQVTDDPGSQEAHHVRTHGVLEAGIDLFADRRSTKDVPLLENQDLASGLGQVGGARKSVVASADNDRVVTRRACHQPFFRSV